MLNQIIQGDCYELMKGIPDGSVDLVLTDPPYNTIAADWDKQPIDLAALWQELKRVAKPDAAFVFTASQPFTTDLITSNRYWFKYELIWEKDKSADFLNAKNRPMKYHENIIVFSKTSTIFNPQRTLEGRKANKSGVRHKVSDLYFGSFNDSKNEGNEYRNPKSVIYFNTPKHNSSDGYFHPTQKPVALFEYLIRTYTNPGETVLDPFAGSGTTALAAHATGRQFLLFEKEPKYVEIANKRLALAQMQGRFEEMVG